MRSLLASLALSLLVSLPVAAADLPAGERAAIEEVVRAQLDAFQRDDGGAAFAAASPTIRDMFRTSDGFMAMVRKGYAPVYRPQFVEFVDVITYRGQPTQRVYLVGPAGRAYMAHYLMQRQADGAWRINGCVLEPLPDVGA